MLRSAGGTCANVRVCAARRGSVSNRPEADTRARFYPTGLIYRRRLNIVAPVLPKKFGLNVSYVTLG